MFYEVLLTIVIIYVAYKLMKIRETRKKWFSITDQVTTIGKPHPFWGHMHLFSNAEEYFEITLDLVQRTKTKLYGGWVMFFFPGFSVCHPDTAKVLLKSSEPKTKYSMGGAYRMVSKWIGDGLLVSDGRKWERNRRLLTPAFHFEILKPYILEYNQTSETLLENFKKGMAKEGSVEVFNLISLATLDTMLRCALSYEGQVQEKGFNEKSHSFLSSFISKTCLRAEELFCAILDWENYNTLRTIFNENHPYVLAVKRLATLVFQRSISPWYYSDFIYFNSPTGWEFTKLSNFVHEFADGIIASRKEALHLDPDLLAKRRLDFLDILLTAKDESGEGLTNTDIRAEVDTFLFEGHDTTASAISWAIYAFGKHPDEQEKVYAEISEILKDKDRFEWDDLQKTRKLTFFLKEVMRMYSTVPIISRWLTKPCVLDGVEIPAHFSVDINIYAIHHHPDVWPDHEQFRPDRFEDESFKDRDPFSYVPFSAGSRNCIGQQFALNEMRVMVSRILKRYKIHLVPNHKYGFQPELTMRAKNGIKVKLEEREKC